MSLTFCKSCNSFGSCRIAGAASTDSDILANDILICLTSRVKLSMRSTAWTSRAPNAVTLVSSVFRCECIECISCGTVLPLIDTKGKDNTSERGSNAKEGGWKKSPRGENFKKSLFKNFRLKYVYDITIPNYPARTPSLVISLPFLGFWCQLKKRSLGTSNLWQLFNGFALKVYLIIQR